MGVSTDERAVLAAIAGMLARPDFLIPIVAAERQFREHYYGLNSAALLEDLFFDALGNYLRQTDPDTMLLRPPTGQKGWDYTFNGLNVSHKVSQRIDAIAAIWDATKKGVTRWSFEDPIVYVLSGNSPPTAVRLTIEGESPLDCRAVCDLPKPFVAGGGSLLIVKWPGGSTAPQLVDVVRTEPGQRVAEALPFSQIWAHVAKHVRDGGGANEIDVLVSRAPMPPLMEHQMRERGLPQTLDDLSVPYRSGVHLLPKAILQDLAVTSNNRGVLIPKPTMQQLSVQSKELRLFSPLPLWYTLYAQARPPDMYSAQRSEYDARFSARGDIDRL